MQTKACFFLTCPASATDDQCWPVLQPFNLPILWFCGKNGAIWQIPEKHKHIQYISCIWFSTGDLISCSVQTDLLSKTSYCWASFVNSWWASASEVCWNISAGLSYNVSALWNIQQCIICIPVHEPKDFMIRTRDMRKPH